MLILKFNLTQLHLCALFFFPECYNNEHNTDDFISNIIERKIFSQWFWIYHSYRDNFFGRRQFKAIHTRTVQMKRYETLRRTMKPLGYLLVPLRGLHCGSKNAQAPACTGEIGGCDKKYIPIDVVWVQDVVHVSKFDDWGAVGNYTIFHSLWC